MLDKKIAKIIYKDVRYTIPIVRIYGQIGLTIQPCIELQDAYFNDKLLERNKEIIRAVESVGRCHVMKESVSKREG